MELVALSGRSGGSLLKRIVLKLDGFRAAFTGSEGLFTESAITSVFASTCCCSLKKLLLGLSCTGGIFGTDGGAEGVESSLTQAGLVLDTAGLGKTGFGSDPVALRPTLVSCILASGTGVKEGFDGDLCFRKSLFISS